MAKRNYQRGAALAAGGAITRMQNDVIHLVKVRAASKIMKAKAGITASDALALVGDVPTTHPDVVRVMGWQSAIIELMRRVLSTLGARNISVVWDHTSVAVAYTDGASIYVGGKWFIDRIAPSIVDNDVAAGAEAWADVQAILYHELAHILYSPRETQRPLKDVKALWEKEGQHSWQIDTAEHWLMYSMNLLEDARIERMFIGAYRPSAPLLSGAVSRHVVDPSTADLRQLALGWVILCGRPHASTKLTNLLRAAFEQYVAGTIAAIQSNLSVYGTPGVSWEDDPARKRLHLMRPHQGETAAQFVNDLAGVTPASLAQEIESLFTRYREMIFPNDSDQAIWITKRLALLLWGYQIIKPNSFYDTTRDLNVAPGVPDPVTGDPGVATPERGTSGTHSNQSQGRPTVPDQRAAQNAANEAEQDGDGGSSGATGGSDNNATNEGDANENGDAASGAGIGGENIERDSVSPRQLLDLVQDEITHLKQDAEQHALETIRTTRRIMLGKNDVTLPTAVDRRGALFAPVERWMQVASRGIVDAVSRVYADIDDEWVRGSSTGRLNTGDYMNARDRHFDVFDEYTEGNEEATSFEVVILLDRSDSMDMGRHGSGTLASAAFRSMWVIQHAFHTLNIPVTVIGYASGPSLISTPTTNTPKTTFLQLPTQGNTNPDEAIGWAASVFTASRASNKLLVSITDGQWWGWDNSDSTGRTLKSLRDSGVMTMLVQLHMTGSRPDKIPMDDGLWFGHEDRITLNDSTLRALPAELGRRIMARTASLVDHR